MEQGTGERGREVGRRGRKRVSGREGKKRRWVGGTKRGAGDASDAGWGPARGREEGWRSRER